MGAILVTGSSGTIGTRLCEQLLAAGEQVIGVDWNPNKWSDDVQSITKLIDLRDPEATATAFEGVTVDTVVHLAANARVYNLVETPTLARDNFISLFNILESSRLNKVKNFFFASSREVYGNIEHTNYTEDKVSVDMCESPYAASKLGGEALVNSYRYCYEMNTVIFRFSNVYGMYDESDRLVPLFYRLCKANQDITIFGEDKCLDFTYIDDTVTGIISAITNIDTVKNEAYNLAYGQGVKLVDIAYMLKEKLNSQSTIHLGSNRKGEVIHYVADTTKAKTKLNFNPVTQINEGLDLSIAWYNQHEHILTFA